MMLLEAVNLDSIHLKDGRHRARRDGMCVLEACAYLSGEPHTDSPRSVSPALAEYVGAVNDLLPGKERQRLRRLIPALLNSRCSTCEVPRSQYLVRRGLRAHVPYGLYLMGRTAAARALLAAGRDLPELAAWLKRRKRRSSGFDPKLDMVFAFARDAANHAVHAGQGGHDAPRHARQAARQMAECLARVYAPPALAALSVQQVRKASALCPHRTAAD